MILTAVHTLLHFKVYVSPIQLMVSFNVRYFITLDLFNENICIFTLKNLNIDAYQTAIEF